MPKLHSTRSSVLFNAMLFGAGLVSILSSVAVGCVSEPAAIDPGASDGAGGAGGGTSSSATGAGVQDKGEELFRAIQPDLMSKCGPCHASKNSNTPWLGGEDPYVSISSWRGMITKDVHASKLLTVPKEGTGHPGDNLDSPELVNTLLPKVTEWLEEEARAIVGTTDPEVTGPGIEPVTPVLGFNAFYLDALGPAFEGMAITFFADAPTPKVLELTKVQIHATSEKGLHIAHPLFVVYPKNQEADPDPVDSCSNVDQYIDIAGTAGLGPGTVILANWQPEAKLAVVFDKVEIYVPGAPTESDGCKNVDSFTQNAVGPLQNNCAGQCHGGGNPAAKNALDMSQLQDDATKACGQVLGRVELGMPVDSTIFVVTQPGGNANHPFKFPNGGYDNFRTAVSNWITDEAAAAGQ